MTDWPLVVQLAVGLLFGRAAVGKVTSPMAFADGVQRYGLVPRRIGFAVGLAIIPAEIFVALSHVIDVMMPAGAYVGIFLSATFLIAVSVNVWKGADVSCYCFDAGDDDAVSWLSIARIVAVLCGEGVVLFASLHSHPAAGRLGTMPFTRWLATAICAAGALGACSWMWAVPQLVEMRTSCTNCGNSPTEGVNT